MRIARVGHLARRRLAVVIGLAGVLGLTLAGSATAGPDRTVFMTGDEKFVPNAMIMATLRFTPGPITVASGDSVTWSDRTGAPHTVTILDAADIPTNIGEVFGCQAPPSGPCVPALAGHFTEPPTFVLGGGPDGTAGLDGVGDSLLVPPNESVSATVTATAGTTLNYICVIHPWMIGSINVR
jgi:plastocyanin